MSFFSQLFKSKGSDKNKKDAPSDSIDIDIQAEQTRQIEEKIKHYQTHGKPKASQKDDPTFNDAANSLAKEDYISVLSNTKKSEKDKSKKK